MSIKSWYEVLNWPSLPNFGDCHTITELSRFRENYALTADITRLKHNLLETLTGKFEMQYLRIMGEPGAGKTSFLYSLIKDGAGEDKQNEKLLRQFVFHIFHVNRADSEHYVEIIQKEVRSAWKQYYEAIGFNDIYLSITSKKSSSIKEQLNDLTDYYKHNKAKFAEKVLIFVIDDVDLLPGSQLVEIATTVIKNLEVRSVKKWLVIRNETFAEYTGDSKTIVSSFFPEHHQFPNVPLYEIIEYRIKSLTKNSGSNPFSRALCHTVTKLCASNLRESLATLKSILELTDPKGLKGKATGEEFVQNYINRISIKAFIQEGLLPNITNPELRNVPVPIPLDLIILARIIQDEQLLFRCVQDCINVRHSSVNSGSSNSRTEFKLREETFSHSVKQLAEKGLLYKQGKNIQLTGKGEVLSVYANRAAYISDMLELSTSHFDQNALEKRFNDLCRVTVDHEKIATDAIYWERQ